MRKLEIVLGLIQQDDEYILQLRPADPRIGAAGLIGCFGGKVDDAEQPSAAVAREVDEETTLLTEPHEWELLGEVDVVSDSQFESVAVHATAFRHLLPGVSTIMAKEGELVRIKSDHALSLGARLTPATHQLFKELL